MDVKEWLGEDNQIGIDIWERKYRYNNESFDAWLDRVSGGDEELRQLISKRKFLFGGRILANRGLAKDGKKITYSNCYVATPPEDNIESIFEVAKRLARTYSYGGGCGVDLGRLSPRGAKINNAAKATSGAVSFMDLYSMVTGLIGQEGRRGALMISLPCNHPDIEEFIDVKNDLGRITKANISVRITNDFMDAVKEKKPFFLEYTRIETGETIRKEVDAYSLFRKLCSNNWNMAEPGMLFWNRIEEWNILSADKSFSYSGTNPCFDGSMELLKADGYRKFEDLCDTTPIIFNADGLQVQSKVWCSGEKDTVIVKTGNGDIICTPDHIFLTTDGDECAAKDLKGKRIMPCTRFNLSYDNRFLKYGFIQGDGQLTRLSNGQHAGLEINIGKKDTDIADLFEDEEYTTKSSRAIYVHGFNQDLIALGFSANRLPERVFPSSYDSWTYNQKRSFLCGCYSANGSVIKKGRVSYKTTCYAFAEQLVTTLKNDFHIDGVYITTNKAHNVTFKNGEYACKESYDINIGRYKDISKFASQIGFYQQYKREQLVRMMLSRAKRVTSVVPGGIRKVYDFTEPQRHWGIVEGCVVHNCGEEPLPAGGSCLLGSMNLAAFVDKDGFDYESFKEAVRVAVVGLDDVLEEGLPLHPLAEQRKSVSDWRQIGLGIFGLADALIKMGVRYGSEDAIKICDQIGFEMANTAIETSAMLAKNRGTYPKYHAEPVLCSPWLIANTTKDTYELVQKYGLHNSQLLTCAPTGTLSSMIGISGGIEPIFANYYTRKTESLKGYDEYYKIYTPIVKEYMDEHQIADDRDLPGFFVTAQALDYRDRINMQAIWQKHIDASISSTINLPNSATIDDVEDIYMTAWKKGLKGVTIYRDGCARAGILTTETKTVEDATTGNEYTINNLPRGVIIKADDNCLGKKRTLQTGCGTLHIEAFFDPDTGQLLETYFSRGSKGGCVNSYTGLSRMISLASRGGIDIATIIDQLHSCGACPSYAVRAATKHDTSKGACCPAAIGNALLEMYNELQSELNADRDVDEVVEEVEVEVERPQFATEQEAIDAGRCPICGDKLVHQGGCDYCVNDGWSHCS